MSVAPLVGVLEKHGSHYAVTPFFERGNRVHVDKPRAASVPAISSSVVPGRGGRARVERRLGRPDVARDVLDALMIQRGLRRRFDPLVEREARIAEPDDSGRVDFRSLTTFTIDPPTARDFDDAISAEELDDGAIRVWVHIADVAAFVRPGSALDREAFRRANSRLRAGAGRADAARGAVESRLLAGAGGGPPDGHGGARVRGRAGPAHGVSPLDHPLRRAARLPARRPGLRGGGARRGAVGGAAGGGAQGRRRRWPMRGRSGARWPWSPPSPSSASRARAMSRACCRPSRPSRTG